VFGKIFGPGREEGGSWGKLDNDEIHELYSSRNIVRVIKSRRIRWAGYVTRMAEGRGVYSVSIGRPKGKRSLGRPRHKWEDSINMGLKETGIDEANWIRLAQHRVRWRTFVSMVMKLRVP
jgi:hypothetical protein